ncbi:hypothetical protein GCM10010917_08310 [Paenibacillus physcomitrellae]|uniref:Uncharacterized protein n=1 Tax=Paenibacillus physcomitrellae TaxID=1619311 RepID=A0ABQ1FQ96_9BACL|nr:hypothetical protein [Paenibacillus physcomitrellae]GGA25681.1 hypothetical protein GCM10010917_08310 [Paenibacillus physcomitrellae]
MEYLKATRLEASFINASPSSTFFRLFGKLIRLDNEVTANVSVGDKIAANPNATASGIDGISQLTV